MPEEFLAIVGPSGCGKSTLLNLIAGLLSPDQGTILMEGTPVSAGNSRIGYMLQRDHLLEWRSIYKNVTLGLEIRHELTPENLARVDELLAAYGLDRFRNAKPSELSGGMRQRAALIRTLAPQPELLLLDEPFSALDYQTRLTVSDDIGRLLKAAKKPAILVTHDISEAISMADRVLVLSARPAALKKIIPVRLSIPDRTPLSSRNAPDFKSYFNLIWKELNSDA
jgi:NitT/TauT family transport system ATP-binding protein